MTIRDRLTLSIIFMNEMKYTLNQNTDIAVHGVVEKITKEN